MDGNSRMRVRTLEVMFFHVGNLFSNGARGEHDQRARETEWSYWRFSRSYERSPWQKSEEWCLLRKEKRAMHLFPQ